MTKPYCYHNRVPTLKHSNTGLVELRRVAVRRVELVGAVLPSQTVKLSPDVGTMQYGVPLKGYFCSGQDWTLIYFKIPQGGGGGINIKILIICSLTLKYIFFLVIFYVCVFDENTFLGSRVGQGDKILTDNDFRKKWQKNPRTHDQ